MEKNTSETLYSLKFAERVRSVELGPGSRRAELGSWSSQEHLEVGGWHRGWRESLGGVTTWGVGWEEMPEGLEPKLEPKPSSKKEFLASEVPTGALSRREGRAQGGTAAQH